MKWVIKPGPVGTLENRSSRTDLQFSLLFGPLFSAEDSIDPFGIAFIS